MDQFYKHSLRLAMLNRLIADSKSSKAIVIMDVDGVLLNPVQAWVSWVNSEIGMGITEEDIERAGNITNLFKAVGRYEEIKERIDQVICSKEINRDFPRIAHALQGVMLLSRIPGINLVCYLTARPEAILGVTKRDLEKKGFPALPVIARKATIPKERASAWKMATIGYINEHSRATILMIDDSLDLGLDILRYNRNSNKKVVSIVFSGPLTHFAIEQKNIKSSPAADFYVANWEGIPSIVRQYA